MTPAAIVVSALLLAVAACSSGPAPRTSTEVERERATGVLGLISTAVVGAVATGSISAEDGQLAQRQIGDLNRLVERSATEPVQWSDIRRRILALAAAWAVQEAASEL